MIVAQGTIHAGGSAGQRWEIKARHTPGAANYVLTVGGEFYASGDSVFELLEELDAI